MKILEYLIGWFLLLAAGAGVFFLFHMKPPAQDESEEPDIATEVPIYVQAIQQADLHQFIEAYGHVDSVLPSSGMTPSQMPVTSAIEGVLTEIDASVCSLGRPVQKGQILFRLDSRLMDVELAQAQTQMQYAQQQMQRAKQLVEVQAASEKEYQDALFQLQEAEKRVESVKTQRSYLEIKAPLSGTIVSLPVVSGQTVSSGQILAEIRDENRLFITAQVPALQTAGLQADQLVHIDIPSVQNEESFSYQTGLGKIVYIDPEVNRQTDSLFIQVQPDPTSDLDLRKGQLVRLEIEQAVHRQCLAIDVQAVVRDLEGKSYIAVVEGNVARRQYVQAGIREGNLIEIEGQGLHAGTQVVTGGAYGLPESTQIRILNERTD